MSTHEPAGVSYTPPVRRTLALLLLLVLGLSLSAGAHPCEARTEAPAAAPAAQQPHCHVMAPLAPMAPKTAPDHPAAVPKGGAPGCGSHGADHPCTHVCHVMAVVTATPATFAVETVTQVSSAVPAHPLRLVARSIDHIPLA